MMYLFVFVCFPIGVLKVITWCKALSTCGACIVLLLLTSDWFTYVLWVSEMMFLCQVVCCSALRFTLSLVSSLIDGEVDSWAHVEAKLCLDGPVVCGSQKQADAYGFLESIKTFHFYICLMVSLAIHLWTVWQTKQGFTYYMTVVHYHS